MAQKTLGQGTARAGLGKLHKATLPVNGAVSEEIVVEVPQSARREYPEVNAAIDRGLADVAAGRIHRRGSYAEYANIEIED